MDQETARLQLLDAAEELFYGRGIQSVGMDDIRARSGVSLKRLYQLYPAKEQLVEAYLDRRDRRWRGSMADYVAAAATDPVERLLAVFDWLERWFGQPDFRGCAWINGFGELGAVSAVVARHAREHKLAFQTYLHELAAAAGLPAALADQIHLLAEGATVTAGILRTAAPAAQARAASAALIAAARDTP